MGPIPSWLYMWTLWDLHFHQNFLGGRLFVHHFSLFNNGSTSNALNHVAVCSTSKLDLTVPSTQPLILNHCCTVHTVGPSKFLRKDNRVHITQSRHYSQTLGQFPCLLRFSVWGLGFSVKKCAPDGRNLWKKKAVYPKP